MQRRAFLGGSLAAAAATSLLAAKFDRQLGLSIYTVRGPMAKDPAGTYKRLAEAGIKTLEIRPVNLTEHGSMMKDAGLKPVHMFIDAAVVTGAWDEWADFSKRIAARMKITMPPENPVRPKLEDLIDLAKKHGVQRVGISMLLPGELEKAIDQMNAAAEKCASAGLELYYHNHSFEFDGEPGKRFVDDLHKRLSRKVRLEIDVFWAAISGEDPVAMLKQWKGRVKSLHLKDVAREAARPKSVFEVAPTSFKEVGSGRVDWKAVLQTARKTGVEHYMIEQDFTPGDPVESIRKSVDFLQALEV